MSLCFTAMLQQARQQPPASIGVRFVNRTMERGAIRCFLAPLKTFVANRLELVLGFSYQENTMLQCAYLSISCSSLLVKMY